MPLRLTYRAYTPCVFIYTSKPVRQNFKRWKQQQIKFNKNNNQKRDEMSGVQTIDWINIESRSKFRVKTNKRHTINEIYMALKFSFIFCLHSFTHISLACQQRWYIIYIYICSSRHSFTCNQFKHTFHEPLLRFSLAIIVIVLVFVCLSVYA